MKSDFMLALTQLSAEKNLPADVVIMAIEAALVSAYRKESFAPNQNIAVKIDRSSGKVGVWAEKTVVQKVTDSRREMTLNEAKRIKPDAKIDDLVMVEDTPQNAGRIAAQTAKQVILQRLNEAEYTAIYEEFNSREGDVVTVVVQRVEPGQIFVDLGRTEGVLPAAEQVRTERYRAGQRLKVVILQVVRTGKGPRVLVSRSHPDLLRRLFEIEVPEVHSGTVEIKAIAREGGFRSKIAVAARQEGVDPVGCCVGLRGIRIQNIVKELNGEKIDVIQWHPDSAIFIANALSPAHIISVETNKATEIATVVVPDKQLSLAIGKEGQNARLAAKLTGWKIDIKSASAAEAEKPAVKPAEEVAEAAVAEAPAAEAAPVAEVAEIPVAAETAAVAPAAPAVEAPAVPIVLQPPVPIVERKTQLRFAEDILAPLPPKPSTKAVKGKKKKGYHEGEEAKPKKKRREVVIPEEEEEF
ncbi:MAG: transcription termination factor NusA [Dehalococcoidales bacterium]|nr:transcription termination factor NusA [Dehalococcoidales bacterium]